jgi:hypothetical protein
MVGQGNSPGFIVPVRAVKCIEEHWTKSEGSCHVVSGCDKLISVYACLLKYSDYINDVCKLD